MRNAPGAPRSKWDLTMSDEYGTVNFQRDRERELGRLRQHYREHREALVRMAGDAPTERLAAEYHRLTAEIDAAVRKLAELEAPAHEPSRGAAPAGAAASLPHGDPILGAAEPGARRLVTPGASHEAATVEQSLDGSQGAGARIAMIVLAGVVVLALIGWLIWRASSNRAANRTVVEANSTATDSAPVIEPVKPAAEDPALAIAPAMADYGTIRKGTRATRQFEVTNGGSAPVTITVARSKCRCLYYEYANTLPPGKKESITVTIDGAKAKAGTLRETIAVTSKKDPSVRTAFDVAARIE